MNTYMFQFNARQKFIDAPDTPTAKRLFQERFGFWPDAVLISVAVVNGKTISWDPVAQYGGGEV